MRPNPLPPASTYRVQLSSNFTLHDLAAHIPYLAELGVTHVYLSPIYVARPDSSHGYDIVDHGAIDPRLGGWEGWERLRDALRTHGLGAILDVVPNHMAADPVHNRLWRKVLAEGPASPAAQHFDIDWSPLTGLIRNKVLLPVLEEPYGAALLQSRIWLEQVNEGIVVRYGGTHLPLAPGSFGRPVTGEEIREINAEPERMHAVLEAQHYRLAYWRAANDEINYRRFFDVNELVAIRTEDEAIFNQSHELILRLCAEDVVKGLRVDHVDGLLDPAGYLQRLRAAADSAAGGRNWIVVEKILGRFETLDSDWAVDGTTGYDALNVLNRLFVSARGVRMLRRFYKGLVDEDMSFDDIAYASKRLVMERTLRSGLTILSHALKRVADASWTTRDVTLNAMAAALVEFIACLPVYRTYMRPGGDRNGDREVLEQTFARAIRRSPSLDLSSLRFLRSLQLEPAAEPALAEARQVVQRLQQYTSGVHAKGIEDTAFYRDSTLLALNEVGGDPGGATGTLDDFHRFNEQRARRWPDSQTATSTHDTKLGEDARIRIATLTTCATEWMAAVRLWNRLNAPFRQSPARGIHVDVCTEYRTYQVLVGVWPADDCSGTAPADPCLIERVAAYMRKAVREAQVHTSWIRMNDDYEAAVDAFVRGILFDESASEFRYSLRVLIRHILPTSLCHSVSQLVLKCGMPGVPDIYQGAEGWALVVTDPDNRQPVDFAARAGTLNSLREHSCRIHAGSPDDLVSGTAKHYVTSRLLQFRRDHRALMARGRYSPIRARGERASAVVAFRRTLAGEHFIVAVPRLVARTTGSAVWPVGSYWGDTHLRVPSHIRDWTNLLSGERVSLVPSARAPLAELATDFPWVVLYGRE